MLKTVTFYSIVGFAWLSTLNATVPEYNAKMRSVEQQRYVNVMQEECADPIYIVEEATPSTINETVNTSIENIQETQTGTPSDVPVRLYTEEEESMLAHLIEAEGGIESYECKLAIGSVVHNRIISDEFPNSMEEVIWQRSPSVQFSVILKNSKGVRPIEAVTPSEDSLRAAEEIAYGNSSLPEDVLVFYADHCDEGWVTTRKKYTKIDHTVFAYTHR